MGWTIGMPSLKLNMVGTKSKHCGYLPSVAEEALSERKGHDLDINPELSDKNQYIGYKSAAELMAYSDSHCTTLRDSLGRALRKDSVRMCVTLIKPPSAYMVSLSEAEQQRFLQDGVDKLSDIIGIGNIKSIAWHYDEQGPHVHVFWEPITSDGRLCAKEMHNLKYLARLNREMPAYLREKGWDIEDCNAYDAAEEVLKSEAEKAKRRQKNGRSSAVYKAAAQQELRNIENALHTLQTDLEESMQDCIEQAIAEVVSGQTNVYDDALFLLYACDDNRFEYLSEEGRRLKDKILRNTFSGSDTHRQLDALITNASERTEQITWEERQGMWNLYRSMSEDFWDLREELRDYYSIGLNKAYDKKRRADRSYYLARYFLFRSRGIISLLITTVWALIAASQQTKYGFQIFEIRQKRDELIRNTANFKKFCNEYRIEIKAGKMPGEDCLTAMADMIKVLDKREEEFWRHAYDAGYRPSKAQER